MARRSPGTRVPHAAFPSPSPSLELAIEQVPVARLTRYARNARTHSDEQVRRLAASIAEFGFVSPIIADDAGEVVAGHGRLAAARRLGLSDVPVVRLRHLSPEQLRALRLADNRLAELAGWDTALLTLELQELAALDMRFDIEVTGFSIPEITLPQTRRAATGDPRDAIPAPADETVSRPGDLWRLGRHRLLCGDGADGGVYARLLDGLPVRVAFADFEHPGLAVEAGDGAPEEASGVRPHATLAVVGAVLEEGGLVFAGVPWRSLGALQSAAASAALSPLSLCVWGREGGDTEGVYRAAYGLVLVLHTGGQPGPVPKGRRRRSNLWNYAGVPDPFTRATMRPVALIADALLDSSQADDGVLDVGCRLGTTLIAAETTGRRAAGVERDPRYVDLAVRRWQALTGHVAHHADTGAPFDAVAAARRGGAS